MQAGLTERQREVRELSTRVCAPFDESYWLERERSATFPEEFYRAVADAGLLGVAMPEAYGGSGLGISEAAVLMQTIAESGACMSGASAVHMNIFGLNPVVVFGTDEQKRRMLPPLIKGYLRLGAYIGDGAVVDHEFGTTDVLIILPVSVIRQRYLEHFDVSRRAA